jgi:heterodisulfide reductase subunit B
MKYLFYPGCSMERFSRPYKDSLLEICEHIGLNLEEIDDWNCCGATEYVAVSLLPAYSLIARNLAIAEHQAASGGAYHRAEGVPKNGKNGRAAPAPDGAYTLIAPCSACYLNLSKTDHYMSESTTLNERVNMALEAGGLHYTPGSVEIRHLLDIVVNEVGLEAVRGAVVRPLTGLRVAPYYGCMTPRPDYKKRWSNPEYPTELDRLLKALGAEVVDFPLKTHCCGGHMTQISPPVAYELIRRLLHAAAQYHADMLVTICPMCQLNLDAYLGETNRYFETNYHIPTLFFTQVMGVAYGLEPKALGLGLELVDARPALAKVGVEMPAEQQAPAGRKPRKKEELPMPRMPGGNDGGAP